MPLAFCIDGVKSQEDFPEPLRPVMTINCSQEASVNVLSYAVLHL